MATLYVWEFGGMGPNMPVAQTPAITKNNVTIGGATTPSLAFKENTRFIRVHSDAICSIEIGPDPVATASSQRMAANQTEYFGVRAGDKIAVITNS